MNQSVPVDQRWQSSSAQLKLRALRASLLRRRRALTIVALALSVAPLSAAAATVPVVACRLQTMAGLRSVSAPSSVSADIGRQWKGQIAYYTIGNLAVFAPAGWHCVGHSGTEGSELRVVPDASDLTRTDLHGHVGVVAALLAGYGGHYMDVLATGAPFFANLRAIAAKEGTRAQPIAGEHLTTFRRRKPCSAILLRFAGPAAAPEARIQAAVSPPRTGAEPRAKGRQPCSFRTCEYFPSRFRATIGGLWSYSIVSTLWRQVPPGSDPLSIVEAEKQLYITEQNGDRIDKMNARGAVTEYQIPIPNAQRNAPYIGKLEI